MADIIEDSVGGKIVADTDEAQKSLEKLTNNINSLDRALKLVGFGVFLKGIKSIATAGYKAMSKMGDYIETLNLFRSTMGASTKAATEFVEKAETTLGLDQGLMMNSVAMLQTLAEGYGLANDEAYIMSHNLTQLAADMSSFLNIPFESALDKLKSGLAGEVKAMRNVGVALDRATLQETMHRLGIEQTYASLTKAQKTELIYYQIMTSTTKMQGDLARTMISPQNAIRILQQEFTRLARAIGSIFIPIALKLIPVVRAVTQVLIKAAQAIASFFGFNISDYESDISSVGTLLEGVGADIDDVGESAGSAAKELQKMLMPFDELNNINLDKPSSGGGGGVGGVGGGGSLGIPLPEYNMFEGATNELMKKIEGIKKTFQDWLPVIAAVSAALATIWAIKKIVSFEKALKNTIEAIDTFSTYFPKLSKLARIGLGIVFVLSSVALEYNYAKKVLNEGDLSLGTILMGTGNAFLAGIGAALLTGSGEIGAIVGGAVLGLNLGLALGVKLWYWMEDNNLTDIYDKVLKYFNPVEWGFSLGDWIQYTNTTQKLFDIISLIGNYFPPLNWAFSFVQWIRKEEVQKALEEIANWVNNHFNPVMWGYNFGQWIQKEESQKKLEEIANWINNHFNPLMWGYNFGQWLQKEENQKKLEEIADWISNNLNPVMWAYNFGQWVQKEETQQKLNDIATWINNNLNPVMWTYNFVQWLQEDKTKEAFDRIIDHIIYWINPAHWGLEIKGWLEDQFDFHIKFPHMYWSTEPATGWLADILSALNLPTSLPKLKVAWYAEGGFPEAGQLFFANEAGPELVGQIGSKTAVANNDQITKGIAAATYNAFMRAMSETGGNRTPSTIVVNVGDKRLYEGFGEYQDEVSNMYGVNL